MKQFTTTVFQLLDLELENHLVSDPELFRPADISSNKGDPSKAEKLLGWKPETLMDGIAAKMIEAELGQVDL